MSDEARAASFRRLRPAAPTGRRARLVCGNWKMNPPSVTEAVALAYAVRQIPSPAVELAVAPPAVALERVADELAGSDVTVFAQDVHWEAKGAFTGQVSAPMLSGLAAGSIVGHSEVRRDQRDDDARVAAKATAALRAGLRVIYCLGESQSERAAGETDLVLERQVREGIGRIPRELVGPDAADRLVVAYEPIWAIGTGVAATASQAAEAVAKIRLEVLRLGIDGQRLTVLYGGSVSASSVAEFARAEGVDGALVGGASLKPEDFAAIVRAFS